MLEASRIHQPKSGEVEPIPLKEQLLQLIERIKSDLEQQFERLPLPTEAEATPGQRAEIIQERDEVLAACGKLWGEINALSEEVFGPHAGEWRQKVAALEREVYSSYHERMRAHINPVVPMFLDQDEQQEYEAAWDDGADPRDML